MIIHIKKSPLTATAFFSLFGEEKKKLWTCLTSHCTPGQDQHEIDSHFFKCIISRLGSH